MTVVKFLGTILNECDYNIDLRVLNHSTHDIENNFYWHIPHDEQTPQNRIDRLECIDNDSYSQEIISTIIEPDTQTIVIWV